MFLQVNTKLANTGSDLCLYVSCKCKQTLVFACTYQPSNTNLTLVSASLVLACKNEQKHIGKMFLHTSTEHAHTSNFQFLGRSCVCKQKNVFKSRNQTFKNMSGLVFANFVIDSIFTCKYKPETCICMSGTCKQ